MKDAARKSELMKGECGASLVELAFVLPLLLLILAGAVDFGRAYYLAMQVAGAAHAGAEYGVQNPTDVTGIANAARYDAPNVPNLVVSTPAYGCECSDGTAFSSSCAVKPTCSGSDLVYRVSVKVSASYSPFIPWPKIPSSIALSNSATMRSGGM